MNGLLSPLDVSTFELVIPFLVNGPFCFHGTVQGNDLSWQHQFSSYTTHCSSSSDMPYCTHPSILHLSVHPSSSQLSFPPSLLSFIPSFSPPSSPLTLPLSSSAHHDYGPWKGLLHQAHEWLDGIEEGGGATRLQDEAIPGHQHTALTARGERNQTPYILSRAVRPSLLLFPFPPEKVGVHGAIATGADDLAVHKVKKLHPT